MLKKLKSKIEPFSFSVLLFGLEISCAVHLGAALLSLWAWYQGDLSARIFAQETFSVGLKVLVMTIIMCFISNFLIKGKDT